VCIIANAHIDRRWGPGSRLVAIFARVRAAGNELAGVVFALQSAALALSLFLEHFHHSYRMGFVVSHPFHKEREKDGARSFLTPSVKMP
jgi:hypothetical protein